MFALEIRKLDKGLDSEINGIEIVVLNDECVHKF
jgi:hypothetical protein